VPSVAVHALLTGGGPTGSAAEPAKVRVRWRNDFDWPGVRMTAAALARYPAAVAWRMSAADYESASSAGPALAGTPVPTPWDPSLCDAMGRAGRAVMEERLLPELIDDLAG
jgi:hypothetical protein